MEKIIQKIREIYPVSDEALQALQANMELRYYPKDTYIVQSGVTDRLVYFIEEGIARSVFHHNGQDTTTWFTLEGDITFGMDSLYYQQPSVESIETLSDCFSGNKYLPVRDPISTRSTFEKFRKDFFYILILTVDRYLTF